MSCDICTEFNEYQDYTKVQASPSIFYHGTRETSVPSIFHSGILSSPPSHGVTGLWLNSNIEAALTWNQTVMDILPGVAFQIAANPDHIRQNRRIKGQGFGNETRFCLELQASEDLPSCTCTRILFFVPTMRRLSWIQALFAAFKDSVKFMMKLPLLHIGTQNVSKLTHEFFNLTSYRLAYRGVSSCTSKNFGGPFSRVHKAFIISSIEITDLLWTLGLQSNVRRGQALQKILMRNIPDPLRQFFLREFPSICAWVDWSNIQDRSRKDWTLGILINVERWTPTRDFINNPFPEAV